jgi:hypothetical protein
MGILDNFEAWLDFEEDIDKDPSLAVKIFKEDICDNCSQLK